MPIPIPNEGEQQGAFHSRCMSAISGEYKTDQANAICFKQWGEKSGHTDKLERLAAETFPPDKFEAIRNVPLFDEHTASGKDGRRKVYDKQVLEQIVLRCNQRIEDTGSFSPSVIGHTPEAGDPNRETKMPELVGFYGPMRLGKVGNLNPRWAIFADEFVRKDDLEKANKHPRRSVELWGDGIIDPVARLGAETPRRDLGLVFLSKARSGGGVIERYARECEEKEHYEAGMGAGIATAPSSTNVSVKSWGDDDDEKKHTKERFDRGEMSGAEAARYAHQQLCEKNSKNPQYSPDPTPPITEKIEKEKVIPLGGLVEKNAQPETQGSRIAMLTPDDVRQIVDALEQLDWVKYVKSEMMSHSAGAGGAPGTGSPGAAGSPAGAPPGDAAAAGGAGGMGSAPPPGAGAPPDAAGGPPKSPPSKEPGGKGGPGEHDAEKKPPEKKGMGEDVGSTAGGAIGEAAGGPVGAAVGSAIGGAAGGALDRKDDDKDKKGRSECEIPLGGMTKAAKPETKEQAELENDLAAVKHPPKRYDRDEQAASSANKTPTEGVGATGSSANATKPDGGGTPAGSSQNETPDKAARDAAEVDRQLRMGSEDRINYAKLQRDHSELVERFERQQERLETLSAKYVETERFAKLKDLSNEYVFDMDKEVERCRRDKMSDAQFDEHRMMIVENYTRLPIGDRFVRTDVAKMTIREQQDKEKFSRETSEEARKICLRKQESGQPYDFEEELSKLRNGHAAAAK